MLLNILQGTGQTPEQECSGTNVIVLRLETLIESVISHSKDSSLVCWKLVPRKTQYCLVHSNVVLPYMTLFHYYS